MHVCRHPTVSGKKYGSQTFFRGNLQKTIECLFKVSLGTATSCICLLKSHRFTSSMLFNEIEMV